ncbi:hypothetical protein NVP1031O_129 [Vibrio phage 1.031.O._10N.261.46.F8]|nr:hypothetical protein NVP1031O_129 [Vibrio phage 1.031.O._10N.261.46.F8]
MEKVEVEFQFEMGQTVKVQVVSTITTGVVFGRIAYEVQGAKMNRYRIQVDNLPIHDYMEPWEDSLVAVQALPVGTKVKR